MIIPQQLQPGDTIAIVSPSSKVQPEYIKGAVSRLESWGYRVIVGAHAYGAHGNFAGTPEERLSDLREALLNPEVKAIMCARGGYGAVHLLEGIAPQEIRDNAKWIIGFSDISALHAAWVNAGVASLHAPMCKHLTIEPEMQSSTQYLRAILSGAKPQYHADAHPFDRCGEVSARVVGGNMAVLCGLIRTPYDLFQENTILFIEDIGERTYKIERMLYNLELAGVLPRLAGLVVGQFTDFKEDPGMCATMYEMIAARVAPYNYPVAFGFPVGHVTDNHPMIEGAMATLSVTPQGTMLTF
ncbi:MAG: LD-carboxypeptidase [Bacteroidaceae bacterium]|nr:LD-carboxypeptidase [Bacteroidaceae bacterium]